MVRRHRDNSPALQFAYDRYIGKSGKQQAVFEEELANAEIARSIYKLREKAGLTQRELAGLVGTTPSVISRLEDARYKGHSLTMLRRIATALNARLQVTLRPLPSGRRIARTASRIP